ncbi:MAG TPA: RNA polymerase subunit sigma-70 [Planctomycetaceae bacterium]|nr:RNA polymerase subunit sigma-70 [Blastopirellula sp.]HAY78490.1 RNA polymerase subunit sigma-70 [Planctomycetaceae bacterium]
MPNETTRLLANAARGDQGAAEALIPHIYHELRSLAAAKLRNERQEHTLQPTAMVNEVYMQLIDHADVDWRDRRHFFAVAATQMRRILIDHARKRAAGKRGGGARRVQLTDQFIQHTTDPLEILALNEMLERLQELNQRHARVIELRIFGGLSVVETATVLEVSPATVKNDFRVARAWLAAELGTEETE